MHNIVVSQMVELDHIRCIFILLFYKLSNWIISNIFFYWLVGIMPRGRGWPRGRGRNGRGGHEIGRGRGAANVGDVIGVHIVEQSTTTTSPLPDLPSSSEP